MKEDIYHIVSEYFRGRATSSDKALLDSWLNESEENRFLFKELENIWKLTGSLGQKVDLDVDAEWQRFVETRENLQVDEPAVKTRALIPAIFWKVAAVLIPAIVVSVFIFRNSGNAEWINIETANNQHSVILPDGSTVWMNKNSTLSYPKEFVGENRLVKFSGEAFFEVSKEKIPFIVETGKVSVKVLGTKFNLRSFENEKVSELYLKEGKVLFAKKGNPQINVTLTQGESAVLNDSKLVIEKNITKFSNATAWLDKGFIFQNNSLSEIVTVLERYYNIQTELPVQLQNCRFSGEFSNPALNELLDIVCLAVGCEYRIENGHLIFSGQGCK